ncbi:MAG: hypothetical protein J1E97_04210 [Muribaculaceae bacterium]|nr:hypothetical protein [Muribaculaceae bacterium]
MNQVTYGVRGLMEWQVMLPTGSLVKPFITINFTGGQLSGYGAAPARYTTADPYIQKLIETSYWYKAGRIVKLPSRFQQRG